MRLRGNSRIRAAGSLAADRPNAEITAADPLLSLHPPGNSDQPKPVPGLGGSGEPVAASAEPAPRRRRRWVVAAIAVVVVAGLAAGLVAWAPWRAAPVLRPTGLRAGSATTSSAMFTWSKPATGPLPDRYVILYNGKVTGSVPGTATAYRVTGLHYGSSYRYQVVAVRGGVRSRASQLILVRTATPPVSAARWVGTSFVTIKFLSSSSTVGGFAHTSDGEQWTASPDCPAGPCTVQLSGSLFGKPFKATLTRAGGVYTGKGTATLLGGCSYGGTTIPYLSTLTLRVTLTGAQMDGQLWEAGSWRGTLLIVTPSAASSTFACSGYYVKASISGLTSGANG